MRKRSGYWGRRTIATSQRLRYRGLEQLGMSNRRGRHRPRRVPSAGLLGCRLDLLFAHSIPSTAWRSHRPARNPELSGHPNNRLRSFCFRFGISSLADAFAVFRFGAGHARGLGRPTSGQEPRQTRFIAQCSEDRCVGGRCLSLAVALVRHAVQCFQVGCRNRARSSEMLPLGVRSGAC